MTTTTLLCYLTVGVITGVLFVTNATRQPPWDKHRGVRAVQVGVLVAAFLIGWPLIWLAIAYFAAAELNRRGPPRA